MSQPEDALLDLISRLRKAAIGLSSCSDDGEFTKSERDLMSAKAEGIGLAIQYTEAQLRESRGEPRRVF